MTTGEDLHFPSPPIWEVGMILASHEKLFDTYDISAAHDLFRREFPRVSRQSPVDLLGTQLTNASGIHSLDPEDPPLRWFFESEAGTDVIQLQQSLIGRNWRRTTLPPKMVLPYPGFDHLLRGLVDQVSVFGAWHEGKYQQKLPEPAICELLYDNFIPNTSFEGERMRLSSIIRPLAFDGKNPIVGLNMGWEESPFIDRPLQQGTNAPGPRLTIGITHGGVQGPGSSEPVSIVRLIMTARAEVETWVGAFDFFQEAHLTIRKRFMELTEPAAHAMWNTPQ